MNRQRYCVHSSSPLGSLRQGNECIAQLMGITFELVFHTLALALLFGGEDRLVVSLLSCDHVKEDAR